MAHNKFWNVLCWNIRGMNSNEKCIALKNAIHVSGCAVICLQETKLSSCNMSFIHSICPKCFHQFLFDPSDRASGGILTVWNSSVFSGSLLFSHEFAFGISFTSTQMGTEWTLVNIYGPCLPWR